jgi:hypothetical protein
MNSLVIVSVLVGLLAAARFATGGARGGSNRRRNTLLPVLAGALALAAVVPGQASAARTISTGIADGVFQDSRTNVRNQWFQRAEDANVSLLRVGVNWSFIAGSPRPSNPSNPADPRYSWTALDRVVREATDRGFQVMFLTNTAPRWAEGEDRPSNAQAGSWKPDPAEFGRFGLALATRYSGSYPDPEGGVLPRVSYYETWNEGNLDFWIAPQYSGGKNTGPELYRDLSNAFAQNVKSVHVDNQIVGPALAPFGGVTGERRERTRPLKFMRDLFCLKGRKKLKKKPCPGGEKFIVDIVSHHPITVTGPPTQKAFHPDDATSGDMGKVKRIVRAADRQNTIITSGGRVPIWVSEYWYRSKPPVDAGVPLKKHARWIQQSLYIWWKKGVQMAIYNLIRDRPSFDPESAFGLYFRDGEAKPAAKAYGFPFVADRKSKRKVVLWGKAPATGKLKVQRQRGNSWKTIARFNASDGKVFTKKVKLRGKAKLRAGVAGERSLVWNLGKG